MKSLCLDSRVCTQGIPLPHDWYQSIIQHNCSSIVSSLVYMWDAACADCICLGIAVGRSHPPQPRHTVGKVALTSPYVYLYCLKGGRRGGGVEAPRLSSYIVKKSTNIYCLLVLSHYMPAVITEKMYCKMRINNFHSIFLLVQVAHAIQFTYCTVQCTAQHFLVYLMSGACCKWDGPWRKNICWGKSRRRPYHILY